ncbi:hypothetical protein THAOC_00905 [Thalassiosira oceanica]|uniref:Uncharacterized protein n=1 Tax=Thalassiosira oceanica TaxID=159749 RepID=K0TEY1_THAOC|nr:hypothetical protein THAOC_00905 [Thalassiosira oceanica]|eukprot:EJK77268.1 hypothetical protein THAOC_00905 [Thalassiosira oceanica]
MIQQPATEVGVPGEVERIHPKPNLLYYARFRSSPPIAGDDGPRRRPYEWLLKQQSLPAHEQNATPPWLAQTGIAWSRGSSETVQDLRPRADCESAFD